MTPEQAIYRANRAKEVVENEAYIEAFSAIEQEILEKWRNAPARDTAGREHLWMLQALLHKLQTTLEITMDSGKVAVKELEHQQTLKERALDWLR